MSCHSEGLLEDWVETNLMQLNIVLDLERNDPHVTVHTDMMESSCAENSLGYDLVDSKLKMSSNQSLKRRWLSLFWAASGIALVAG